ncbi:hypothetical protein D3C73_1145020 [compost metagenome]
MVSGEGILGHALEHAGDAVVHQTMLCRVVIAFRVLPKAHKRVVQDPAHDGPCDALRHCRILPRSTREKCSCKGIRRLFLKQDHSFLDRGLHLVGIDRSQPERKPGQGQRLHLTTFAIASNHPP